MKLVFIADFFTEHILGGGELNNEELIEILKLDGFEVVKIQSHLVNSSFIEENYDSRFIVANFINLRPNCIEALYNKRYIIYEHDHKYLTTRDPAVFENFLAPKEAIINYEFYKQAAAVLCQSKFHYDIVKKNLHLDNLINLSGNIWSLDSLEFMRTIASQPKKERCSILHSHIEHKNTLEAVSYCNHKNLNYDLIANNDYKTFLLSLGANDTFVFFPKTPETLSRIAVEARMMGMKTITNKMLGATKESWYTKRGDELIDYMAEKRTTIKNTVLEELK
jgi:hypothetical protein|tara:strand:- start:4861 stop:5697 length:837 start_codon:yes stop_codon:yes gene_type:complete